MGERIARPVRPMVVVGIGTTFTVHFPLAGENAPAPAQADGSAPGEAARGETILVVEDDPGVRRLASVVLEEAGYVVLSAEHPEAVLRLLEGERIDLLLTDVVMPGMNGRELAKRVVGERPGVRVLFTSGYPGDETRRDVRAAAVAFLEKPDSASGLLREVNQILR